MDQPSPHDLTRLATLRTRLADLDAGKQKMQPAVSDDYGRKIAAIEAAWPDDRLLRAYQETDGIPGNAEADAILAEIRHRDLDV